MESKQLVRWPRLVIGVAILLFAGVIYAWSVINTPFRVVETTAGEVARTAVKNAPQLGHNYTLTIIFFCIGGLTSGLVSKKTPAALRLAISAALVFSGFFISSRLVGSIADGSSYTMLYLAYGVMSGAGIGVAYNTVIGATNAWFPDKQGLCSGIQLMGFGLSALVIGETIKAIGRAGEIDWGNVYAIFAIAMAGILLLAAFLVKPPPKGTLLPAPKTVRKAAPSDEAKDYTLLEMLRRPSFYMIFVYCTIVAASGSAAIGFARDIVADVGATADFAVTTVGIIAVANGLGRLSCGWLFDHLRIRQTQMISASLAILAPLTVVFGLMTGTLAICFIGMCLCGFTYGFCPTTLSVFAARFYGPKNFSPNFSMLNLVLIPAPFAAKLAGNLKDASGEFLSTFLILTGLTVIAFFVNLGIKKA